MKDRNKNIIPDRTSPGSTRSAFPLQHQGGFEISAMVGEGILRIGTVNGRTLRGRSGEVVENWRWLRGGGWIFVVCRRQGGKVAVREL